MVHDSDTDNTFLGESKFTSLFRPQQSVQPARTATCDLRCLSGFWYMDVVVDVVAWWELGTHIIYLFTYTNIFSFYKFIKIYSSQSLEGSYLS